MDVLNSGYTKTITEDIVPVKEDETPAVVPISNHFETEPELQPYDLVWESLGDDDDDDIAVLVSRRKRQWRSMRPTNPLHAQDVVREAVELGKNALFLDCIPKSVKPDLVLLLLGTPLLVTTGVFLHNHELHNSMTHEGIPWWRVTLLLSVALISPVVIRFLWRAARLLLRKYDKANGESYTGIQTVVFYMRQTGHEFVRFIWVFTCYCTYYVVIRRFFPVNEDEGSMIYEIHYWVSRIWVIFLFYLFGSLLVLITETKITKHFSTRTFAAKIASAILDEYSTVLLCHTLIVSEKYTGLLEIVDMILSSNVGKAHKAHPRKIQNAQHFIMHTAYLSYLNPVLGISHESHADMYTALLRHTWKVLRSSRKLRLREARKSMIDIESERIKLSSNHEIKSRVSSSSAKTFHQLALARNFQPEEANNSASHWDESTMPVKGELPKVVNMLNTEKPVRKPAIQDWKKLIHRKDLEYYFDKVLHKSHRPKVTVSRIWAMISAHKSDPDSDTLTEVEFGEAINHIMENRENLRDSLFDSREVVHSLRKILRGTIFTLLVLPAVWTLGIENLVEIVLGASSALLAASFVFGKAAREVFESIVYLFGMHVYDVGDLLHIDGSNFRVNAISLLTTEMIRWDGALVKMSNARLASQDIINHTTSGNHVTKNMVAVDAGCLTENVLEGIRKDIGSFVEEHDAYNGVYITVREPCDTLKFFLAYVVEFSYSFDPSRVYADQSVVNLELLKIFRKYNISYTGVELGQLNVATAFTEQHHDHTRGMAEASKDKGTDAP